MSVLVVVARQEMYESYLHRVDHWMQDAPAQDWTKAYDKETYSKAYVCVSMLACVCISRNRELTHCATCY